MSDRVAHLVATVAGSRPLNEFHKHLSQKLWLLDPPCDGFDYVVTSECVAQGAVDGRVLYEMRETAVFAADVTGDFSDFKMLLHARDVVSHHEALAMLGYQSRESHEEERN